MTKRHLSILIVLLAQGATANSAMAQRLPTSEEFSNLLSSCAAGANIEIKSDLLGSVRSIYEGQRTQGAASFKSATEFLKLMPEADRLKAYELYTACIQKIISRHGTSLDNVVRQLDSGVLDGSQKSWSFSAPAGSTVKSVGLNCKADMRVKTSSSVTYRYELVGNTEAPVIGDEGQEVFVTIELMGHPAASAGGVLGDPMACHGKFFVHGLGPPLTNLNSPPGKKK